MASIDELLAVLDPTRLNRVVSEIERISENIERLTVTVTGDAARAFDEVGETAEKSAETFHREVDRAGDHLQRMLDEGVVRVHLFGDEWEKTAERVEEKWKQTSQEIQRHMTQARGPLGTAGNAMGLTGGRGVFQTAMTQIRTVAAAMPMGGLLGMMLYGRMQQAEWIAAGQRIARVFSQVGNIGDRAAGRFFAFAKNLEVQLGITEGEIAAVANGFAQFGIGLDQALSKGEVTARGFEKGILGTALAFDVMTKSSAGTTAQVIGMATEVSGEFERSSKAVFNFGFALRDTGANFAKTMAGLSQGLSTLRLQRQGVEDLASGYLALSKAMTERFGGGPQAQAMALQGTMAAARGISGMSEGLMAVIGGRIGERTGVGPRTAGIDAIIAFQEGTLGPQIGQQTEMFGQVVKELADFAGEITNQGSRNERVFALMKAGGFTFEGARAIIDVQEQIDRDIKAGMPAQEAIERGQKELNKAFNQRYNEESEFRKVMRKVMFELAKIGGAVLDILVATLPNLIDLMQAGLALNKMTSPAFAVKQLFGAEDKSMEQARESIDRLSDPVRQMKIQRRISRSWDEASAGIDRVMQIIKKAGEKTAGGTAKEVLQGPAGARSAGPTRRGRRGAKAGGKELSYNVPNTNIRAFIRFESDDLDLAEPSSLYG